jgi:hypothetical protein
MEKKPLKLILRPRNFFQKSPRVRKPKTFSQEGKCQFYQSFLVILQDPGTSNAQ